MTDATLAKPWLTQYPSSIPAEIDVSVYANLAEMLDAALTKYADRVAFHCSGTDVTYRELDHLSTALPTYAPIKARTPQGAILQRAQSVCDSR
jgi:acyl-CoA synthetase (AMP-forming)/AMP-acid ligase II